LLELASPPPETVSRLGRVAEQPVTHSCLEEERSRRLLLETLPAAGDGELVYLAESSLTSATIAEAITL
jgi:hypothetical protein